MTNTVGFICCDEIVLRAVKIVLLTPHHTRARLQGPVEGIFVALCQLVAMYWFASIVILNHSLEVCVDVA